MNELNKERAKEIAKPGWTQLIDKVYSITEILSFANIIDISLRHSMLQIIFEKRLDNTEQYVLDCIAYKIERESAKTCEGCGKYGNRRELLENKPSLCTRCYTLRYNEMMESAPPDMVDN